MEGEEDPLIGREIDGRYRVLRRLGRGGMGTVYVAEQPALGREVALKFVTAGRVDPEAIARFKKEALAVGQLTHPNIVSVHDFGVTSDGLMYLAMELLAGKSLAALLEERRALDWRETLPILEDVLRGLSAAHERGIIHRDLKPANVVLVDVRGRPFAKILDFGVAKLVDTPGGGMTQTGIVLGTPGYIAPEHVHGITEDPRSDLYSLGVMWFEMLSGAPPFTAETPMKLVLRHLQDAPPPVVGHVSDVPKSVEAVLMRLLSKEPEGRPSVEELLGLVPALASDPDGVVVAPPPPAPARTAFLGTPSPQPAAAMPTPATGSAPRDALAANTLTSSTALPLSGARLEVPSAPASASERSQLAIVGVVALGAVLVCVCIGVVLVLLFAGGDDVKAPAATATAAEPAEAAETDDDHDDPPAPEVSEDEPPAPAAAVTGKRATASKRRTSASTRDSRATAEQQSKKRKKKRPKDRASDFIKGIGKTVEKVVD